MYSTCLYCTRSLGRNEVIEHLPIGRKLAYDAARGRLWVVCLTCGRWNLTPFEDRWEAIDECLRSYQGVRTRYATGEIGIAKLPEGIELVQIGRPQRPEFAHWRYGEQLLRRRRDEIAFTGAVVAAAIALGWGGPAVGLATGGIGSAISVGSNLLFAYRHRVYVPVSGRPDPVLVIPTNAGEVRFIGEADGTARLRLPLSSGYVEVAPEDTFRVLGRVMRVLNPKGASRALAQEAAGLIADAGTPERFVARMAREGRLLTEPNRGRALKWASGVHRVALEMAGQEEHERRALEGELRALEAEWKEAERIASIADDLLLPLPVRAMFQRMTGRSATPHDPG